MPPRRTSPALAAALARLAGDPALRAAAGRRRRARPRCATPELGRGGAPLRGVLCRRRRRWTPVKGTGTRVYDPVERAARCARSTCRRRLLRARPRPPAPPLDRGGGARGAGAAPRPHRRRAHVAARPRRPARARCPQARIRLAVGRWSEEVARQRARGRGARLERALGGPAAAKAPESRRALARKARALRRAAASTSPSTCRATCAPSLLMRLTGARARVGYANTGGGSCSPTWCPSTRPSPGSSRTAARCAGGRRRRGARPRHDRAHVAADPRCGARAPRARAACAGARPLVGLHPSGGRAIKQWPVERWREVARAAAGASSARRCVVTGGAGDAGAGARASATGCRGRVVDLAGRLVGGGDDGRDRRARPVPLPGHRAHAHGLRGGHAVGGGVRALRPRERYFSGGSGAPRHRATWWCAASCGARPATSSARRPRSARPTSPRSACAS